MSVRVLYFARSRELVGRGEEEVQLSVIAAHAQQAAAKGANLSATPAGAASADSAASASAASSGAAGEGTVAVSVRQLLSYLVSVHPALSSLVACSLLALNQEFVACDSDAPLRAGDEIAFIQPISGG
jgi:molybdopterin converting factor small subunit